MSQATPKSADSQSKPAERFYLPELDVLRFFAFFAVFVSHMALYAFYSNSALGALGSGGAFGVDLFFTLSGYLLTSLLLRERGKTGDIDVKAFYVRRGLRIWPLYYFFLVLCFLLTLIPESFIAAPLYPGDLFVPMPLKSYFFMAIFLFNFNIAGSMLTNPSAFMTQLWSISVEEQFYLFWPWIARFVPRRRIVVVPLVMIAISCIARATLPLDPDSARLDQYLNPSRSDCSGNLDSASTKVQSAACYSSVTRAGGICELGVCLVLLWIN